ncbi:putative leucine rich repeat [Lyophyllum shimeji]|uniref:Leucine rich repeat n=1 Tax=Lyophyllum shimeji TaxID=47721 RepID=A0A9P3PKH7_LYOSH|nr:putative leucine rich repeat [Lyophyllum shimeji]
MDPEPGDDYLRRLASFVRNKERNLAEAGFFRRRRPQRSASDPVSLLNPLGWFGSDPSGYSTSKPKPVVLSLDTHRLFYVLMRMEALGIDVGTLDVHVDNPSRPMSYVNIFPITDKSDTLSLASFRSSLSAVSGLSLGGGWFGRLEPPTVDSELKYLYSSFTKIPALSIHAPGRKVIAELVNESPNQNALPLDAFKNLQSLECVDIDPRTLLGWDRLAEGLRSLKVKKSGLEDITDIFIGAVIDDQARRQGSTSRKRQRRIPRGPAEDMSYFTTRLPDSVPEDADAEESATTDDGEPKPDTETGTTSPPPSFELSPNKWAFLRHLSLSDNALTFFPSDLIPYLTSLTHLDLSSNLLNSVPPGLGALYNLVSLNLSDNMIDSVLGIYRNLGGVLHLNIAHNRLESICGLERLAALERVDLRGNLIEESAEIGRLAVLPNIAEIWIEGNPLVELEEGYRVVCFDYFWKEHKTITLDGTPPSFYEKRNLTMSPPEQMSSSRPISTAYSPPVVAVGHHHPHQQAAAPSAPPVDKHPTPPFSNASPSLAPIGAVGVGGKARRKVKRIVELDGDHSDGSSAGMAHSRERSTASSQLKPKAKVRPKQPKQTSPPPDQPPPAGKLGQIETMEADRKAPLLEVAAPMEPAGSSTDTALSSTSPEKPARRTRHSRYQTEFIPSSTTTAAPSLSTPPPAEEPPSSVSPRTPPSIRMGRSSATFASRSGTRRARVSASVYEPPSMTDGEEGGRGGEDIRDNAEAYRRQLEALKKDMGDGWLKVFSQSQMKNPSP